MRILAPALAAAVLATALPARAVEEEDDLFVKKPFVWKEDERDKRLLKTKLMKAMETGFKSPACARVAGSLLAAFAEATPYFHKKDDRFALFRVFTDPITTDKFPADDYLVHMLHRAMIDGKAPEAWLTAAKQIKAKHKAPIDLARLAYAVDGPSLVDSIDFGLPVFLQRFDLEVLRAPTVAQESAVERFQDRYLDRDLAWPGLLLADIQKVEPPKPKKGQPDLSAWAEAEEGPKFIATLVVPQTRRPQQDDLFKPTKTPEPLRLIVKLAPEQYIDIKRVVVGGTYLVHGRFFGFQVNLGQPELPPMIMDIRDGLLFEDRDWSGYRGFSDARDVEACDLAINDLSPLGLKDRQGIGNKDGFAH